MSLIPANYAEKQHALSHCTGVKRSLRRGNVPHRLRPSVILCLARSRVSTISGAIKQSSIVVGGINTHLEWLQRPPPPPYARPRLISGTFVLLEYLRVTRLV